MAIPVVHRTYSVEPTYPAPPARLFAAYANPETKRRGFAEDEGFEVEEFTLDFRVGGFERTRFRAAGAQLGGWPGRPASGCSVSTSEFCIDLGSHNVRRVRVRVTTGIQGATARASGSWPSTARPPSIGTIAPLRLLASGDSR
jgi:hypothetical protein